MRNKKPKVEIKETSAFASLIEDYEKSKKRAKFFYISGGILVVLSVFSFLLFGPITVPVFSELGEKILGEEEVVLGEEDKQEEEVKEIKEEEVAEEKEEVVEEEPGEEEKEEVQKVVTTNPKTTTPKTTTPPEPEPEIEVPQFSCSEDTMQSYVNVMCTNFSFIGQTEEHLTPAAQLESFNTCVSVDCDNVVNYPDLLLECRERCLDWVEKEVAKNEGFIQDYNSNIQYYSNLLISCGWTMSEVHELKVELENKCVYSP